MTAIRIYKTYSFKDKDPVIDSVRTATQDEAKRQGKGVRLIITQACERSGVAIGTIYGWLEGVTRRPQYATVEAFMRGLGYTRGQWRRGK